MVVSSGLNMNQHESTRINMDQLGGPARAHFGLSATDLQDKLRMWRLLALLVLWTFPEMSGFETKRDFDFR